MQVDPFKSAPADLTEDLVRVHMDLPRERAEFLDALALYWNVLHEAKTGKRRRVLYVRKTAAERLMLGKLDEMVEQLRQMFAAVGPFPKLASSDLEKPTAESKAKDHALMTKYVNRVVAWDRKAFGDK